LLGPTGIGKSSVSWPIYRGSRLAGHNSPFLDLDQVGFFAPESAADPGNHRLKAGNLAAVWREFRATGTSHLVALAPLDRPEALRVYREALPRANLTVCRLRAGRGQLDERIALRGKGITPTWSLAGDMLKGLSALELRLAADRAWAQAGALEAAGLGDLTVDTDGRTVEQIAAEILDRTGWAQTGAKEISKA
jgi:hypothetical protein